MTRLKFAKRHPLQTTVGVLDLRAYLADFWWWELPERTRWLEATETVIPSVKMASSCQ